MSLSSDKSRPKNVRFVDVTSHTRTPDWLRGRADDAILTGPDWPIAPLLPPEVPSHARPALAPLLESVRPPPMASLPSKFPSVRPPPSPSQYPGNLEAGIAALDALPNMRRTDTVIEDLVPRVEEEAAQAISDAVDRFLADRARSLEAAESQLIELVNVICRRVLLRELTLNPLVIEGLVQAGLQALGGGDRVTVRLGPFFEEAVDPIAENLRRKGIECCVLIDPTVGPRGCQLETELGRVDESVETRLGVLLSGLDTAS